MPAVTLCVISSASPNSGTLDSLPATLTVEAPASIAKNPTSVTVHVGQIVSFVVTAGGTAPLSYQWFRNGVKITNNTTDTQPTFSMANVQLSAAGSYTVQVSNGFGPAVTSAAATLTVVP